MSTSSTPRSTSLRQALLRRRDGRWPLLAAAAGDETSVSGLVAALQPAELEAAGELASAPSVVEEHVEALAAADGRRLVELAALWRPADDDPWWTAAWRTALRHLARAGAIRPEEVSGGALELESRAVWGDPDASPVSWRELRRRVANGYVPYGELRRLAHAPLGEETLGAEDVDGADARLLRLLRGRADRLDGGARALVLERAREPWPHDGLEQALAIEIARELGDDAEAEAARQLGAYLSDVRDPREVAPAAYVLLGDWVAP